ncbi:MBL fold metallo-hydrolase [Thermoplasmatales archaeon ex4484_30]|nr:MAG: MBL fold metallo-hydrolase [Thermoplasmatales archaeon ex4484_30]
MKVQFLGGADEVGRLGILIEHENHRLLFDYGLTPEQPPKYPMQSPEINFAFLSHAHLDHSGMLPWLCSRYDVPVFSTPLTKIISEILFKDTLKIADANGYPFPYSEMDVLNSLEKFIDVLPGEEKKINGMEIAFHSSGHIPGSIMFEMKDAGALFACDINTIETRLMKGAKPVKCNTLFMEGTYAGVEHPRREQLEKEFLDTIDDIVRHGGLAVVPAFAVGRTQEMAMILDGAYEVWLDGMGGKISDILLKHPEYIKSASKLKKAMESVNIVYSNKGRKMALSGDVVLTTSGMMNGGPVLWYVDKIRNDKKSAVILTGYQVEGTNGRTLIERREIELYGVKIKVNCDVKFFDFSAHAGHSQLLSFAKACSPEKVVIFHSDDASPLANDIKNFADVYTPKNGEILKI